MMPGTLQQWKRNILPHYLRRPRTALCLLNYLTISLFSLSLMGCDAHSEHPSKKDTTTIITVKPTSQTIDLFYKGTIEPIKVYSVLSPVAGHIAMLGFQYGEAIKKQQLLATISADTLADDYQKQLSDYISKKDALETSKNNYTSSLALYRAGVETHNNVSTALSTYNNNILALNTSRHTLAKTTHLLNINMATVEGLTLNDIKQVTQELNKKFKNIAVYAHYAGVALHPLPSANKNSDSSNDQNNQITVGDDIKQKQLLLSIGDLNGYSTHFNVSEVDIHRFKLGQKVIVTGPAFPYLSLIGKITGVASQANVSQEGTDSSMAQFAVVAQIPHITLKQAKAIDIGMSAKIDVPIKTKPAISIPINALSIQDGQTTVQVLNSQNKPQTRIVTVGTTLVSRAVISEGLKAGDRVVVPND